MMPKVTRIRHSDSIEVELGAPLMRSLLQAEIPVASSCGGDGICGKCIVQIREGAQHLSPPSEFEDTVLQRQGCRPPHFRLSCQAQVLGDIAIDAPYW